MLRKVFAICVLILIFSAPVQAEAPTYNGYPVVAVQVNGRTVPSDVPAIIMEGRTLVPLGAIARAIGGEARFDENTNTVFVTVPDAEQLRQEATKARATLGEAQAQVAALKTQLAGAEAAQANLASLQQQVALLQNQLNALRDRLAALESMGNPVSTVYERARPAVVGLTVFTRDLTGRVGMATGTGVIAWRNSSRTEVHIFTNGHVVADATSIYAVLNDGSLHTATIWSTDADLDYASLVVKGAELPAPIAWGDPDDIKVGDPVVLVGNPQGYRNSVSAGVLSGRLYMIDNNGYEFLQTDAAASPGSSGGPMLDRNGNLIGLVTQKNVARASEGLVFAISLNAIRKHIDLSNREGQSRAYLGAVLQQNYTATAGAKTTAGMKVIALDPQGPLAKAGVRVNDELMSLGKTDMQTLADLRKFVDTQAPNSTISALLVRGASNFSVSVTLGSVYVATPKPVLRYVVALQEDEGAF